MVKNYKIEVDSASGDFLGAFRKFFSELLTTGALEALLIPQELPSKKNVVQTLVTDPNKLDNINPLAFVMPVNSARLISQLTDQHPGKKLGVVIRNCEIRAVIELIKLQQINNENLVIIGVDCFGTFSLPDYANLSSKIENLTPELLKSFRETRATNVEGFEIRPTCIICKYPIPQPETTDISIGIIGVEINKEILIQANSPKGEEIMQKTGLTEQEVPTSREPAVAAYIEQNSSKRTEEINKILSEIDSIPKLLSTLATCIKCYNCREACPICYCKECIFDTQTLNPSPAQILNKVEKKGVLKIPMDTLLYHITRMNHMITSCVGCGQCESACPNDIPVARIFNALGQEIQKIFEYIPGRDLAEELPLATFKEDELAEA
ncbi:MAG: 4Fe-4S dicluster domain-containing protein [Thermoplasmata archaeon]|nr:4Fe-4S dicluster domain-containing protein [Thermoplasmata archaeon]